MDNILKNLDSNNVIRNSIPLLIDAFVSFYGEKYRNLITEKLSNMITVGYYDSRTLSTLICDEEKNITDELLNEVFEKIGIVKTKENLNRFMGYENSFRYPDLIPIISAVGYIETKKTSVDELVKKELYKNYKYLLEYIPNLTYENFLNHNISEEQMGKLTNYIKNNLNDFYNVDIEDIYDRAKRMSMNDLTNIHHGVTKENVDKLIENGELDYLLEYAKVFREAIDKYNTFVEKNLQQFKDMLEKMEQDEDTLDNKYFLQAVLEFKDYLTNEDQAKLDEAVRKGDFKPSVINGIYKIFGYGVNSPKSIEYFDKKSDDGLRDPNKQDYYKDTIKRNRIAYFKARGIDLGDDYNAYVNNPRCKEIWPSYEEVAHIIERFDYYENEYNIELYSNNIFYLEALEQANKVGLIDKGNLFGPSTISHRMTTVRPNIIQRDGKYYIYPMVAIYSDGDDQQDDSLIHELNHVIELSLQEVGDGRYSCICGWDYVSGEIDESIVNYGDTVHRDSKKREYEMFNEIINELLAQKVSKMMHDNGVYILTDKDHCKDGGGTFYEFFLFLVNEFFETYLQDIIASRLENNMEIIWNKVGKENFDNLNELFHVCYEEFLEFKFYQVFEDIMNKKDTELVRKFNTIKERRNEILAAMKEYSLNGKISL